MRTLAAGKEVRALPLLEALQAAGVPVRAVRPYPAPATGADIDVEDAASDTTIAAVLAAHDVAAIDAAAQQGLQRRQQVRQAIVGYPDLGAPTNAQTAAVVKALCLAVAELYRTT